MTPLDESAIDAATMAQKSLGSDALRQIEELITSDPVRQAREQLREFDRLQMDETARLRNAIDANVAEQANKHQQIWKDLQETLLPSMSAGQIAEAVVGPDLMRSMNAGKIAESVIGADLMSSRSEIQKQLKRLESMDFSPPRIPMDLEPRMNPKALEAIRSIKPLAQQQAEAVQSAIVEHIRKRQGALREDQQLLVYCETDSERIEVRQIELPNHHTVILHGIDPEGNETSLLATLNNVRITCKTINIDPPKKPYRIGFIVSGEDEESR